MTTPVAIAIAAANNNVAVVAAAYGGPFTPPAQIMGIPNSPPRLVRRIERVAAGAAEAAEWLSGMNVRRNLLMDMDIVEEGRR